MQGDQKSPILSVCFDLTSDFSSEISSGLLDDEIVVSQFYWGCFISWRNLIYSRFFDLVQRFDASIDDIMERFEQ